MAGVSIQNVSKSYDGKTKVVKDVSFEVYDKEFVVLVGPSGCGKSTILRMIAGLESITGGDILIDGQRVNDLLPKDRDIAMVFQNYALYPHMTVYQNMAFGLKIKKMNKKEIDKRVREAAAILEITHLLGRKPGEMSGGQRQRVAIGRAIVRKPKVFLFDEPLSNLDAKLRVQMRIELQNLHRRLNSTMIYVTHDQTEAMTLGERIIVLKDGIIMQIGTPMELYDHPQNLFVAGFIGSPPMNLLYGKIESGNMFAGKNRKELMQLPESVVSRLKGYHDRNIYIGIRPENITENAPVDVSGCCSMHVSVVGVEHLGSEILLYANAEDTPLIARLSPSSRLNPGSDATLHFNLENAVFFDADTEDVIK
ncbi:MAG: sn-glycerol-3-phosphate ABC transporter ATP-binding protein UgpC [Bacteroidetes bacterium]|nr:sn-glycerol-3-phosphate ABC transporter ATP-binding protein UgpC [Bacteroidota bacterium]